MVAKKEIRLKCEIHSNYNAHILGVAKIGFNSEYSEKYLDSIPKSDIDFLKSNNDLLKWKDGKTGILTNLIIFFPNYLNLKSKTEMISYFDTLNIAFNDKSFSNFNKKYKIQILNLKDWFLPNFEPELFLYKNQVKKISQIYINNYDKFISDVWPLEKNKIENKIDLLYKELSKYNFIKLWEKFTKLQFKYKHYDIVLTSGIKNGPTANSLGYEKNWFYYDSQTEWMIQFFCHEIGTHILIDLIKEKIEKTNFDSDSKEFKTAYFAYENLCSFFNKMILKEAGLIHSYKMEDYDGKSFSSIYNKLYSKNEAISAKELFEQGIAEYIEVNVA